MKTLFVSAVAMAATIQFSISFAQDTIPILNVDSITVVNKMTVSGQTFLQQDATASRDLTVEGDLYARNRIFYPNAPSLSGSIQNLIVWNSETGTLEKSGLAAIQAELWKFGCIPVNGIVANPMWTNGPNKIFYDCPLVNTGVGTSNPLVRLHVAGDEMVDGYARIADRLSVGADPSTFSRMFVKTGSYGAGLEINGTGNTGSYPKLIWLQFSNNQTELIKATNTSLNFNPFIVTGNGAMTLNNGTANIFDFASDGQLIMRNGLTGAKTFQFDINGLFRARRVRVDADSWADYVFEPGYQLMPLNELETYIAANKHLPAVPSEKMVTEEGIDIAEMNEILLQKIEELTLYLIEQNGNTTELQEQVKALQMEIEALKAAKN